MMRFVRSYVEGIAFLKQNKEFSQKVLAKYLRTSDPEYLEGAYDYIQARFHCRALSHHQRAGSRFTISSAFRRPEIRSRQARGIRRYQLCR